MDDDTDLEVVVMEGLHKARQALEDCVSEYGYDPAYVDTRFTAWIVDSSFTTRLRRIEYETEVKE